MFGLEIVPARLKHAGLLLVLSAMVVPEAARAEEWDLAILDDERSSTVISRLQPHGTWIVPFIRTSEFGEDATGAPFGRVYSTVVLPFGPTPEGSAAYVLYSYAVQIHRPDAPGAGCVDALTIGSSFFAPFDFDEDGALENAFGFVEGTEERIFPTSAPHTLVPPSRVVAERGSVTVHFDAHPICPDVDEHGRPITGVVAFAARRAPTVVGGSVRFSEDTTREAITVLAPESKTDGEPECVVGDLGLGALGVTRSTPLCRCVSVELFRENRCHFWLPDMEIVRRIPWSVSPASKLDVSWEVMPYRHGFEGMKLSEVLPKGMQTLHGASDYSIYVEPTGPGKVFAATQPLLVGKVPLGLHTTAVKLEHDDRVQMLGNTYLVGEGEDPEGPQGGGVAGGSAALSSPTDHGCSATGSTGRAALLGALLALLALWTSRLRSAPPR
jgi:hypothetical protein